MSLDPDPALVAHLIACTAYTCQAYEVALDLDIDDPDDHEILLDQIDAAGAHLVEALVNLHPGWREMSPEARASRGLKLFRKHRPDFDESARGRDVLLAHLRDAIASANDTVFAIRWQGPKWRFRDVVEDVESALDHLEIALYLLDPEGFRADLDVGTPTERLALAERIETIELAIEEHRAMVRCSAKHPVWMSMN